MYELRHYSSPDGRDLFGHWLDGLRDRQAQARIAARMTRLYNGNFGEGKRVVLLCDGGDKRTQTADIGRAIDRWNEWQKRGKK